MPITTGSIDRAVVREDVPQESDDSLDRLAEIEQQIQVEISGTAAPAIAWTTIDITFDVEFADAIYQRYSNLTEPHFTFGVKLTSETPVAVFACVRSYATDDRETLVVGATVAIGVMSGTTLGTIGFAGRVDLCWEGYGSVPNEPSEPNFAG